LVPVRPPVCSEILVQEIHELRRVIKQEEFALPIREAGPPGDDPGNERFPDEAGVGHDELDGRVAAGRLDGDEHMTGGDRVLGEDPKPLGSDG